MSRGIGGIVLTEFGNLVLTRSQAFLSDMARLRQEIAHLAEGRIGSVTLALSTTTACTFLPNAFKRFRRTMPSVEVKLQDSNFSDAVLSLRQGTVDFAIMHVLPNFECPDDIESMTIAKMPFVIGMRKAHPLSGSTSLQDLIDADWLLAPSSQGIPSDLFSAAFSRHGLPLPNCLVTAYMRGDFVKRVRAA